MKKFFSSHATTILQIILLFFTALAGLAGILSKTDIKSFGTFDWIVFSVIFATLTLSVILKVIEARRAEKSAAKAKLQADEDRTQLAALSERLLNEIVRTRTRIHELYINLVFHVPLAALEEQDKEAVKERPLVGVLKSDFVKLFHDGAHLELQEIDKKYYFADKPINIRMDVCPENTAVKRGAPTTTLGYFWATLFPFEYAYIQSHKADGYMLIYFGGVRTTEVRFSEDFISANDLVGRILMIPCLNWLDPHLKHVTIHTDSGVSVNAGVRQSYGNFVATEPMLIDKTFGLKEPQA